MIERKIVFENFRTIGVKGEDTLNLNYSLDKGKMGDLVVLIGPSNAGKSNILDGLECLSKKTIDPLNSPDFIYDENLIPKITVACYTDDDVYRCTLNGSSLLYTSQKSSPKNALDPKLSNLDKIKVAKGALESWQKVAENYERSYCPQFYNQATQLNASLSAKETEGTCSDKEYESLISSLRDFIATAENTLVRYVGNISSLSKSLSAAEAYLLYGDRLLGGLSEKVKTDFQEKYGFPLCPNVLRYTERKLTDQDLGTTPQSWQSNPFFVSLFQEIGLSKEEIGKRYSTYQKYGNPSVLKTFEENTNKKIADITKQFNKMYCREENGFSYHFDISFYPEKIQFGIRQGDIAAFLSKQSTGFAWFFNFYFNCLEGGKLAAGDVLILDDPAINLTVLGQIELRKFLKCFASKNGITIVIATHIPFLVDPDFFDEIRVVSRDGKDTKINNHFYTVNYDYPDSLTPIARSLSTSASVVLDPNIRLIFVEGITDYNYLTTAKFLLGVTDLAFLPINGLGRDDAEQDKILKELVKIHRNPIILTDSDGAGVALANKAKAKYQAEVIGLKDISAEWVEIEDVFSLADKKKFNISKDNKHSGDSSLFKTEIVSRAAEISKETKDNFKKIIDRLED